MTDSGDSGDSGAPTDKQVLLRILVASIYPDGFDSTEAADAILAEGFARPQPQLPDDSMARTEADGWLFSDTLEGRIWNALDGWDLNGTHSEDEVRQLAAHIGEYVRDFARRRN